MEKDALQKEQLAKLFWSWGFLTRFNVRLYSPLSAADSRLELTDVDVLGHKIGEDLHEDRVCGDCKTLKNISPINRAFWQRGLMEYLEISRGYIVLRKSPEDSHKQTARQLGITLFDDPTFEVYYKKLGPVSMFDSMNMFKIKSWGYFQQNIESRQKLRSLLDYRDYWYWTDRPNRAIRMILMEVLGAREKIDEQHKQHRALVLDSIILFSSAMINMIAELFHIHSVTDDKDLLDNHIKAYIYGGREVYDHLNKITTMLIELKKGEKLWDQKEKAKGFSGLSLPDWDKFLQLYRTLLEAPRAAVHIPRVLQFTLFERVLYKNKSIAVSEAIPTITTHTVKLAADVINYFLKASQLFEKFGKDMITLLDQLLLSLKKE